MEEVVLLDETGHAVGTADKATVHHSDTPLHLAFSCYVVNADDQVLVTRRAAGKKTWPGAWTNSCCGHPMPGEHVASAARRRLREELGFRELTLELVLPRFRYRAVMNNGVVENEMCPVYRADTTAEPVPDPSEIDAVRWIDWAEFGRAVLDGSFAVSPWCREQVGELLPLGAVARDWPTAPHDHLPAAARGER